jgi:energy-coupling factor transporter transmembrane protein EcfT
MSYRKIFWGVVLVLIGILFILKNVHVIYFDWVTILRLWPVILILWGISLIPVKDYLKLIFSVLAIGLSFLLVNRYDKTGYYDFGWDKNRRFEHRFGDDDWKKGTAEQELYQSYDSVIQRVELNLEAAAGDFRLNDTIPSDKLLTFWKKGDIGNYSMTSEDDSTLRTINLKIEDSQVKFNNKSMRVELGINPKPIWDFNFDIGAASINFDLSKYKVGKLSIDGGASSIDIKLGDLNNLTEVDINAGASSIDIRIPKDTGAELHTETVLSSRNFEGFKKAGEGYFRTDNFDKATKKITIDIDAGVSSVDISRY